MAKKRKKHHKKSHKKGYLSKLGLEAHHAVSKVRKAITKHL